MRKCSGLWSNTARALVSLAGEDRERLLNGLVTCEVQGLASGQGVRGFFTDVKGHVLADVSVLVAQDRLRLELPAAVAVSTAAHIENYIVADRVTVEAAEGWRSLTLVGPRSAEILAGLVDTAATLLPPWSHLETSWQGHEVLVLADGHYGIPAVTVWALPSGLEELRRHLQPIQESGGLVELEDQAVDLVQVEEGIARFGIDYGSDNLPQETGLDDLVSYSKGCYLGQEVVARLHYRGQAARGLCRLEAALPAAPPTGCSLILDKREVGTITRAVKLPAGERVVALAMIQRRALEAGTELCLPEGGTMRVVV